MKIISGTTVTGLTIFLCAYGVVSKSISSIGDIGIETQNNGSIYCDSLICPPDTTTCQVTKRNDPNNSSQLVKNRKCIGTNGTIIEETTYEPNIFQGTVNINIVSGVGGLGVLQQLSPQEKMLLKDAEKEVEQTISSIRRTLEEFQRGFENAFMF